VESKNGAVIRKHIGCGYVDASQADRINDFSAGDPVAVRQYLREGPSMNALKRVAAAIGDTDAALRS
jgi:hypothetical protein